MRDPKGWDEATLIMSGLSSGNVIGAIDIVVRQYEENTEAIKLVSDYDVDNVSKKVARIIMSYTEYVRRTVWKEY